MQGGDPAVISGNMFAIITRHLYYYNIDRHKAVSSHPIFAGGLRIEWSRTISKEAVAIST